MIIALFVIAAVISTPIVATVIVSVAIRREESAWSLGQPARGAVQAAARRVLDFHTEDPAWPRPRSRGQATQAAPALRSVGQPRESSATDSPGPIPTSNVSIRTAA